MKILRAAAFILPAFVAISGLVGGAAVGQGGRSGHSTASPIDNIRPYAELQAFGRCFATTNRVASLALLATAPGSREESDLFDRRIGGEQSCVGGGSGTFMSIPMVFTRGAIAEGLLKAHTAIPAELVLPAPTVAEVHDLGDVARCYADGHRSEVQALLAITPGTPEETAAVAALWNDFRACMPSAMRVRLNAPWIRFLLAEALLRLPEAGPRAAATGAPTG